MRGERAWPRGASLVLAVVLLGFLASGGLAQTSAVKCENVYTLSQSAVVKTIGTLPASLMTQVDDALKASLALQ